MSAEPNCKSDSEIEVTPAMIEAGAAAVLDWDPRFADRTECAEAVYRAMESVRRELVPSTARL